MENIIEVWIELIDESVGSLMGTKARLIAPDKAIVLETNDYNPEAYAWMFKPGDTVRLERKRNGDEEIWYAVHHDPSAVKVWVNSVENELPFIRETHAIPVGNDLYRLLPTPHYTQEQQWEFPPESIVRLGTTAGYGRYAYPMVVAA